MKPPSVPAVVALCLVSSPAWASDWVPTSTTPTLALGTYVTAYHAVTNRLNIRRLAVDAADVEIARRRDRTTMEIDASPSLGLRGYHYTSDGTAEVLGEFGGEVGWVRLGDDGERYSARARVLAPTSPGRLGRVTTYGVSGTYAMPLLRNFLGREFDLEVSVFEQAKLQAEAYLAAEALFVCFDAISRYIDRYVAQERLRVHLALLAEKRRTWRQTAADYRRRMITKLDLLAAKADWLAFQADTPRFYAALEAADAALLAFIGEPWQTMPVLAPPDLDVRGLADGAALVASASWPDDPRMQVLDAAQAALEARLDLIGERNGHELDVQATAGVDRLHDLIDPRGRGAADVTDIHALVGLRWLWPLQRPSVVYERRLLDLQIADLAQRRAELVRELATAVSVSAAVYRREVEAVAKIEAQLEASSQQIAAAYREFRNGKLEFQNYLDHWAPHQAARLAYWDRRQSQYAASLEILAALNRVPAVCRDAGP